MNVQDLLVQLFEEAGYHHEKQVRLKKISFVGPAPGTYRFDKVYNEITDRKKAYLTTKQERKMFEFICNEHTVTIYWHSPDLGTGSLESNKKKIDLRDPNSVDEIFKTIDEHP